MKRFNNIVQNSKVTREMNQIHDLWLLSFREMKITKDGCTIFELINTVRRELRQFNTPRRLQRKNVYFGLDD